MSEPHSSNQPAHVAVLIPCLNEEVTIGKVIQDFQKALPDAEIIVFDNNCTDRTAEIAKELGARVIEEKRPGKGYVIASMFEKVDADYYVMVDGDDTYDASKAPELLEPVQSGRADMVVGTRLQEFSDGSFRPLHVFGNNLVRSLVNWIFQSSLGDIMSGYRVYTKEVAQTVPVLSSGFEVETELTIRILDAGFVIEEITTPYKERPEGSVSKLRTFHDGFRVLATIANITKAYKPFTFFGLIACVCFILGLGTGIEVIVDYFEDYYVNKVPTAVLSTGFMLLGFGSFITGVILNTLNDRFKEVSRMLQRQIRRSS